MAAAEGVSIPQEEADHILQKVGLIIQTQDRVKIPRHISGDRVAPGEQNLNVCGCPQETAVGG